jgi:3-deoxy-D-manno-octulosonic-acid transferase
MQNFPDVVRMFLEQDGAVQVKDAAELELVLGELLGNAARRDELGRKAQKIVQENQGAVERTVDMIIDRLDGGELYITPKHRNRA